MKKLLSIFALLLGTIAAFGQIGMSIGSKAELVPDDPDASSYYRQLDVNDNVCAIIKVVPDNTLSGTLVLQTRGGMTPVAPPGGGSNYRQESGEWWYWVSPKVTNIMFTCEGYSSTDWLGVSLQPGKVYRLKLNVDSSVTIVKSFSGSGQVPFQMTIEPREARVAYGPSRNQLASFAQITDGFFDTFLAEGKYFFRIESKFYETLETEIEVKKGMGEWMVKLTPAFNTLAVYSQPAGAEVYVDGDLIGTTPIEQSARISKGTHTLVYRKANYYVQEKTVKVYGDGKTMVVQEVTLKPQFGTVILRCDDPAADLIVTDPAGKEVFRGKSGSRVELNSQTTYKLEASRPSHIPQSCGIIGSTIEGSSVEVKVEAPVPIYGELQIVSDPSRAEVYIDGERAGTTIFSKTMLIGDHQVELRKEGYETLKFTAKVERNQTTNISKELKKAGSGQQSGPTGPAQSNLRSSGAQTGTENGHEWVDLGLGVVWATCNVGAYKPEDYGNYFSWGETSSKNTYEWKNYAFRNKGNDYDNVKFTKYNSDSNRGLVDNKTALDVSDDVAHVKWGGRWRMPTKAEFEELFSQCTWTWTTQSGVKGYLATSKVNGKTIFFPANGYKSDSGTTLCEGRELEYWSSSRAHSVNASCLTNFHSTFKVDDLFRCWGFGVRAVFSPGAQASSYSGTGTSSPQGNALVRGGWREKMRKAFDNPSYFYNNGRYKGGLNNGRNGLGAYWWTEDDDFFWGDYAGGDRNGNGIYYIGGTNRHISNCNNCIYYVGPWKDNKKNGKGTCYDKDGKLIYYGDFKDDAPTGTYPSTTSYSSYKFECVEYSDGDVYIGETKDGKRHGYGVYIWSDGGAWYGPWEDGERMGKGIYMSYDNKHTLGRWDKNTRYDN